MDVSLLSLNIWRGLLFWLKRNIPQDISKNVIDTKVIWIKFNFFKLNQ